MKEDRLAFFRQSSWVLIATVAGGGFMWLVQAAAQQLSEQEYGVFASVLTALAQMAIPALGLQTVFAQQAVAAITDQKRAELAGTVRGVVIGLLVFWAVAAAFAVAFHAELLRDYNVPDVRVLWLTLAIALVSVLNPVFAGLVQGRQDFLWFGWGNIVNGAGRFIAVFILVVWLNQQSIGAVLGVLAGALVTLLIFAKRTTCLWLAPAAPFSWTNWFRRVTPLTLGLGAFTYMFSQDMLTVQKHLPNSGAYGAARIVGTALVFLTTPLAAVMFPKIVRSHALSEKSNVLLQALGATGIIGALAALACTIAPELPLKIIRSNFVSSGWLVPWFAWCMLPLAIANVLINNLLARERFAAVPWMIAVAVGYGVTLHFRHGSFTQVITTLGTFSTLLVAVCVVFTIRKDGAARAATTP